VELPDEKPNRVTVVNGWIAGVTRNSSNPEAAYDFLSFLTNRQRSLPYVTTPAYGFGPYRLSHIIDTAPWSASGWTDGGTATYLAALRQSLNEVNAVAFLRIDASHAYHQSLDEAARAVFQGDKSSTDALDEVAKRWREISEERGHDRQRRNYRYSLGMPVLN
jgi:multiple sugar transport system substrate-binding protein